MDSFRNGVTIALAIAMLVATVSSNSYNGYNEPPKRHKGKGGTTDDVKVPDKVWDNEKKHEDQRKEFSREANDFDEAVEVPDTVWDTEKEWERTHPNEGRNVIRQIGDNLDPPAETCLTIKVVYNNGWVNQFNSAAEAAAGAQAVVDETQAIYQERYSASNRLNSRITFNIAGGAPEYDSRADATYQATGSDLQSTAVLRNIVSSSSTIQHYAFLTGQDNSGAIGIAYLSTACLQASNDQRYKTSINEYYRNIQDTAGVMAHEIGHALGMPHDFVGSGSSRYDRNGVLCTNQNGIMDYGARSSVNKFSACSKQDFKDFYNQMLSEYNGLFCLTQNCDRTPEATESPDDDPADPAETTTWSPEVGCGGEITADGSVIVSPNHPNNYPEDVTCDWIVRFPEGTRIAMNFLAFNLQYHRRCRYDRVRIWDGDHRGRNNRLAWPGFCGSTIPETFVSPSNEMFIRFASRDAVVGSGFEIRIEEVASCGGTITSAGGVIKSQNHPDLYPNNEDCVWVINFPEGETIELEILAFNLEYSSSCYWDWVEVHDGNSSTSPLIGNKLCGSTVPEPITSSGSQLYVKFHSDSSVVATGFEILVNQGTADPVTDNPEDPTGCGAEITTPGSEFQSPDHPQNYPNNEDCTHTIRFADGERIKLEFLAFSLESHSRCSWDWFEVHDGADESAPLIGSKMCGSSIPEAIVSSGNELFVKFHSDYSVVSTGYKIRADLATDAPPTTPAPTNGPNPTSNPQGCGIAPAGIVGGSEATPYSLPWQVALVSRGGSGPFCGGTLISPTHVLTAAHCTSNSNFDIIVGEHSISDSSDGTRHQICRAVRHPNYNSPTQLNNDFSIVHLREPVVLGARAVPACLPDSSLAGDVLAGQSLTVSGWGTLSSGGGQPNVLHQVSVPAVSNAQCSQAYSQYSITDKMICAGSIANGGVDSCQGDSGGPLTYNNNGRSTLVGVVSWGIGCASAGNPGVYARVTEAMDFVNSEMAQGC